MSVAINHVLVLLILGGTLTPKDIFMNNLKKILSTAAVSAAALFGATQANALVYSPYNQIGSTETIASVTGGYLQSWWVEDGSGPGNASPAVIELYTEGLTGLSLTSASNPECTGSGREGLGGSSGSNAKCIGSVFTVKLNDDAYAVFVYAAELALNAFQISLDDVKLNGKLSHVDVFSSSRVSPIPVPGAFLLLASGLAGLGALSRKKRKT